MKKKMKNRYLTRQNRNGEIDARHLNRKQSIGMTELSKFQENGKAVDIDKEIVLARLIYRV